MRGESPFGSLIWNDATICSVCAIGSPPGVCRMLQSEQDVSALFEQGSHDDDSALCVALFDQSDELLMSCENPSCHPGNSEEPAGQIRVRWLERLHEHGVDRISRRDRDEVVKLEIQRGDLCNIIPRRRLLPFDEKVQLNQLLVRAVLDGAPRGLSLEQQAHVDEPGDQ